MSVEDDLRFMQHAIALAEKAEQHNEVPVGAVLVYDNKIIGEGWNRPISTNDPCAHAEIIALREGGKTIDNYRLLDTTLYVTLEPCLMCIGAMIHARIKRLVFSAHDPKTGAVESQFQVLKSSALNHQIQYESGLLKERSSDLLKKFFLVRRKFKGQVFV